MAGTTTWKNRARYPGTYLLADGTVVQTPELEQTSSGVKVRVRDEPQYSTYARDVDDLTWAAVARIAARRKTKAWMPVFGTAGEHRHAGVWPSDRQPVLHFLEPKNDRESPWRGSTTAWWRYRHPTLPIEATVIITIAGMTMSASDSSQTVTGRITVPSTHPDHARYGRETTMSDTDIGKALGSLSADEHWTAHRKYFAAEPLDWGLDGIVATGFKYPDVRTSTAEFLRRVRAVENIDALRIPDLRNPAKPTHMTLTLVDSNINGAFIESMCSFLDSNPAIDKAIKAYADFRGALRDVGLILDARNGDQLLAALHAGAEAITVDAGNPAGPDGVDVEHTITLRMATGTFIVNCNVRAEKNAKDPNAIAEHWQEAMAMASITGRESELLAYARRYAMDTEEQRARATLAARQ